jgi:prophage tail gpP-like protein
MADPVVELTVGGKRYGGWESVKISRSIEALAGSFSLSISEKWAGQDQPWPIGEGDECVISIAGVSVITGFIDRRSPTLEADTRSLTVEGRDRSGDVVDCSAQLGAWQFKNVNVLNLASKICEPYGVRVSLQPGLVAESVTLPKKHSIDPGDTAAAALENLCRIAGLLAIPDGFGGLVLSRTGTDRLATNLVEGRNILRGSATFDAAGRFRTYEVMGSHKGRNDLSGKQAAGVKGTATDLNARDGRTLIIRPEHNVTGSLAKSRAEWEAATRSARGDSVRVTVQGWVESVFDPVWPINHLVEIRSPSLGVNGDMLIAGVTLTQDLSGGTLTELDLRNPKAFTPDPTIAKAGGGGNRYWKEIVRGV